MMRCIRMHGLAIGGIMASYLGTVEPAAAGGSGACCLPFGACVVLTESQCSSLGGVYGGDGSTCGDLEPCEVTGSCCLPDLHCENLVESECTLAGGRYEGDLTICDELYTACPVTGACCLPDGSCVDGLTEAECSHFGGGFTEWAIYQGFLTGCESSVCVGACCIDGSFGCSDGMSADACEAAGGQYQGHGSDCASTACPQIVQCRTFSRIQSLREPPAVLTFDKFDDLGGLRRLKQVCLSIDGQVVLRIAIRANDNSPTPVDTTVEVEIGFLEVQDFPFIAPPPQTFLDYAGNIYTCCPGACLPPGETCDYDSPIVISSSGPLETCAPESELGFFIASPGDTTFATEVFGRDIFLLGFVLGEFSIPVDVGEGKATVTYDYDILGACCNPCDGTCTLLDVSMCVDAGGIWQGELVDCEPDLCSGGGGPCAADVDDDGAIGFNDVVLILSAWGQCSCCPEDVDGDGGVGFNDLVTVLSQWGECP